MKSPALLLIAVAAIACASRAPDPEPPGSTSASASHPPSVGPPKHEGPHAGAPPSAPPPQPLHKDSAPIGAWLDPGAPDPVPVREAVAVLTPASGSHVTGVVRFRDDGDLLDVTASVDGLTGGVHAYHVHVFGDCSSPDAESAGPHFHFTGSSFDKRPRIITGNLGDLRPDDRLTTTHRVRVDAELQGRYSIIGRAVVVHERGNDPTSPPDGAAGRRLACGVIGIAGPASAGETAQRP